MARSSRSSRGAGAGDFGDGDDAELRSAPSRRGLLWRFRRGLFLLALFVVAAASGTLWVASRVPLPEATPSLDETTYVCTAEVASGCDAGSALVQLSAGENRSVVAYDDIPQVLRDAVIAAEDQDFFNHKGVDPWGIARAAWTDIRSRSASQGGSTITQQYVKNAYLDAERTLGRKVNEAIIAIKLEQEISKEEILARYLNTIYFGRGAYGVEAASQAYFGVSIRDVDLAQAAYLAALIRAPEAADATRDPDVATRRRTSVLDAMAGLNMITVDQAAAAAALEWNDSTILPRTPATELGRVSDRRFGNDYIVAEVRRQLIERYGWAEVHGGGLRVYTTIDPDLQRLAFEAVTTTLDQPGDPSASLVAVDDLGRIRAMVGGTNFETSEVNLALGTDGGGSGRQAGSTFKPIVLAQALNGGISAQSLFHSGPDIAIPEANDGEPWLVSNYNDADHGVVDLIEATRVSSNVAYAQLMMEVGPFEVAGLAARLGVKAPLDQVNSLALGTEEVSVLDVATAYSTFANRGERVDPTLLLRVEKKVDGEWVVVDDFSNRGRDRVLPTEVVDTVNYALANVVTGGSGRGAAISQPAAGKTGTTQDSRDAWFAGFTCKLTAAAWVGYPGGPGEPVRPMTNVRGSAVTGGGLPATIWQTFMEQATVGLDSCPFSRPDQLPGRIINRQLSACITDPLAPPTTAAPTTPPANPGEVAVTDCPLDTEVLGGSQVPPTSAGPASSNPPANQPNQSQQTQPQQTQPAQTQPSQTQQTQPPVTEPVVTQPPVSQPQATQPQATQPSVTQPSVTQPTPTQPLATTAPTTTAPAATSSPVDDTAPPNNQQNPQGQGNQQNPGNQTTTSAVGSGAQGNDF